MYIYKYSIITCSDKIRMVSFGRPDNCFFSLRKNYIVERHILAMHDRLLKFDYHFKSHHTPLIMFAISMKNWLRGAQIFRFLYCTTINNFVKINKMAKIYSRTNWTALQELREVDKNNGIKIEKYSIKV